MAEPESSSSAASVARRNPPTIWDMTAHGFSQISVAEPGRLAVLSGQVATPPDGGPIPPDLADQAPRVAANLAAALTELGATPHDVLMIRLYVVHATTDRFNQALAPIKQMLGAAMPSVTTIGVQALYTPEMQLEVEMMVRVP